MTSLLLLAAYARALPSMTCILQEESELVGTVAYVTLPAADGNGLVAAGGINAGFLRSLIQPAPGGSGLSLAQELIRSLKQHAGSKSIFVTGHSLGGALATIFAQMLSTRHAPSATACYVIFFLPDIS